MSRPDLTTNLSAEDFRDYYWLKAELVDFCRRQRLPTGGAKLEVVERIAAYLHDGTVRPLAPKPKAKREAIPDDLTLDTPIGQGWTCGQKLRAFFQREAGASFRFNLALIDVVKAPEGRTLGDALAVWAASKADPDRPLGPQLEYNRHARAYSKEHPDSTREEILADWNRKRASRRSSWD